MKDYKLIIFDKDGTLCQSKSGKQFINSVDDQELIEGVAEKIAELKAQGKKIAIASNQGGVAFDIMGYPDVAEIMAHAVSLVEADACEFCPFHPGGKNSYAVESFDRKPNPGMLLRLMLALKISPAETLYVGDREEDELAALNAHISFMWAKDFFGWKEEEK